MTTDLQEKIEVKKISLIVLVAISIFVGIVFGQLSVEKENNLQAQEAGYKMIQNFSCFKNNSPDTEYEISGNTIKEKNNYEIKSK